MTDARESETSSPAFDLLLARMGAKGDFPGLSGVAARILNLSSSDRESVASLTNEILKTDVPLSAYGTFSGDVPLAPAAPLGRDVLPLRHQTTP